MARHDAGGGRPTIHYPPLERIERIEFRKGSGQILYGPQSIGAMINFVTAPQRQLHQRGQRAT